MFGGRPQEEEFAYRQHYLRADIQQVSIVIIVLLSYSAYLHIHNLLALSPGLHISARIAVRAVPMLVSLIFLVTRYRITDPHQLDRSATVIFSLYTGAIGVNNILIGGVTGMSVALSVLFVFGLAVATPLYAVFIIIPMLVLIISDLTVMTLTNGFAAIPFGETAPFFYMIALGLGIPLAAHQQRVRYQAFKAISEQSRLNEELSSALSKVKILGGMLPICANCKKIRDDQGYYQQIEHYITEHSEAEFTHGICPDCAKELYPDIPYPGIETEES